MLDCSALHCLEKQCIVRTQLSIIAMWRELIFAQSMGASFCDVIIEKRNQAALLVSHACFAVTRVFT